MPEDRGDDRPEDTGRADSDDRRFSFSLPPIRLPPMFPDRFRVLWPGGGNGPSTRASRLTAAAALVAFDLVDAALALTVDTQAVAAARVLAGALVAAGAFGLPGLLYATEGAAVLGGVAELTVAPTLTLLLVVRLVREVL
ncbi:hypothetical protein [Halobacterium jilantaiense]|uniref:Uncharacterized protein n=1 Tax=Halobacterium jilantaiense TaxID=355548 RepID=A0A1I0Q986_9EURY|nr:hypothetical protein [Halobacterium jilantaiense]SEW23108.1 hypothetical protein SAMN04487945_2368 [Halobacterium jilantaiense]